MFGCRGGYAVFLALAATLATALAPPSYAGGCPPAAVSYSYSYAAPAAVSYAPISYAAPVKVIKEKVYVPQAVKVYASPDFYSSSQDYYRDKILTDAMAGKVTEALQLQQRLQGLEQQLQQSQQLLQQRQSADLEYQEFQRWKYERQQQRQPEYAPPSGPSYPPEQAPLPRHMPPAENGYHPPPQRHQPPPPEYAPQPQPRQRLGRSTVPDGLEQAVAQDCRSCHGATKQEAGVDLRNLEDMSWELRVVCLNEVLAGTMPYGRHALPAEKKALWQEFERVVRPNVARR